MVRLMPRVMFKCIHTSQALLHCKIKNTGNFKKIIDATHGILFFASALSGLNDDHLNAMAKGLSETEVEFINQFREGSTFLNTLRNDVPSLFNDPSKISLLGFYETLNTPTVAEVSNKHEPETYNKC